MIKSYISFPTVTLVISSLSLTNPLSPLIVERDANMEIAVHCVQFRMIKE